ncbi:MAG TPA: tetratricopeptide repeat protein [Kineosporiaceae bacterium]|nr:tetratricopeptide repeat protein [Kineosporiaceae bacterium]
MTEAHLDVLLPELARSLTSLGVVLTELGRHDEAQTLDLEALTIYLRLHRRHPDRFAHDVENAKRNTVIDLMNFGRTEGEAARELGQLIRASGAHSD